MNDSTPRGSRGELAFGLISAFLGLATLAIVLFAPLESYETSSGSSTTNGSNTTVTVTHGHRSLWSAGIDSRALPFLVAIVVAYIVIGVGTVLHVRLQLRLGRWLRWCGVAVAFLGSIVGAMSIGLFLFPAATLGLIAALGGMNAGGRAKRRNVTPG